MMKRFQTLLIISTCAPTVRWQLFRNSIIAEDGVRTIAHVEQLTLLAGPEDIARHVIGCHSTKTQCRIWYRIPLDQTELSISKIPPTDSPKVRPGRYP